MNIVKPIAISSLLALTLTACDRNDGPAEQTGEKIDNAMQDAQEQVEQAAETAGEKLEEAGDKIREETSQ